MTDYLAVATKYINEKYGSNFSLVEESIYDSDRFYCFTFQTSEFIRTGNFSAMTSGQGYMIINKEDNRIFDFGSRHSLEKAIEILIENLRTEKMIRKYKSQFKLRMKYDLKINSIKKLQILIDKLKAYEITYVIPEAVADSIFRIAKPYNAKSLAKRLKEEFPIVFHGIPTDPKLISELLTSDCCDFDLPEHQEKSFAKYVDKATDVDMQPIW